MSKGPLTPEDEHRQQVRRNLDSIGGDSDFLGLGRLWLREALRHNWVYNFSWLGRPIIQCPQDIYAVQEIIWAVQPDLVIETGIAHGGSLILSASMLALLDYCEAARTGAALAAGRSRRRVVGIDIDLRAHNRAALAAHPLAGLIETLDGSSVSPEVASRVRDIRAAHSRALVFLDSNHAHEHVLQELRLYAPLVSRGSYCVVWDTGIEDQPADFVEDRPWGKGNNPKTAVQAYLRELASAVARGADGEPLSFEVDRDIEHKIAVTGAAGGFLRRR